LDNNSNSTRPNIVLILADDLGYGDLSCYGQQKFSTPNIDNLARNGIKFLNHYAGSTVCAPSRSTLMTGLHTGHTPIRGNVPTSGPKRWSLPDSTRTLSKLLEEQGYKSGIFGKWGLGQLNTSAEPLNQGFKRFFGYIGHWNSHLHYPPYLYSNRKKIKLKENLNHGKGKYAPDEIHKKALKFIEKHKDSTFFLYFPTTLPHAELAAPDDIMQKYLGKYGKEKLFLGADSNQGKSWSNYNSQENPKAAFAAMMNILDTHVGEIVDKLKEHDLIENTIIIFTSDNGPHNEGGAEPWYFNSNGELRGIKRELNEGGIKVPLIVNWGNKIKKGSKTDHICANYDFFPTFMEMLGLGENSNLDGISFLPTLLGKSQKKHEYLYWEFHEKGGIQAVRLGKWKGIRLKMSKDQNAPIRLLNLNSDPKEKKNLALKHPEIVSKIDRIMKHEHKMTEDFRFGFEQPVSTEK